MTRTWRLFYTISHHCWEQGKGVSSWEEGFLLVEQMWRGKLWGNASSKLEGAAGLARLQLSQTAGTGGGSRTLIVN